MSSPDEPLPEPAPELPSTRSRVERVEPALGPDDATIVDERPVVAPPESAFDDSEYERLEKAGAKRIGRYLIIEELGKGGMGIVYRAIDTMLHRPVAIKMILTKMSLRPEEQTQRFRRFQVEATATARLHHPNIVLVHDVGEHESRPYYVMEFIEGDNLERFLRRGRPSWRQIAEIVRQLALALDHAHAQGVLHRDVKPENVVIDRAGNPHLMDFGLAKVVTGKIQITAQGQALGTPCYMSPEQAMGKQGVGPASDVYSLGGVLYRALAGRPPYAGEAAQVLLRKVIYDPPAPPRSIDPSVPASLEEIALRCLEKEPRNRYPSAGAVASALATAIASLS